MKLIFKKKISVSVGLLNVLYETILQPSGWQSAAPEPHMTLSPLAQIFTEGAISSQKKNLVRRKLHLIFIN